VTLRVAVVGGSLGGLTAALLLRDLGCEVDVYERSAVELSGFGAGIVVHPETVRYLVGHGVALEDISAAAPVVRWLGADGGVVHEEPRGHRFTAWSTLYRGLLDLFGRERYHQGAPFVGLATGGTDVTLRFATGARVRADLAVLADGVLSTARRRLEPAAAPRYAGYVGWRGTVEEGALSAGTFGALYGALTYARHEGGHIVAYPIPNLDGSVDVGRRLMNYVWYRNVAEGPGLDELMTDRTGLHRPISLHPGAVQEAFVDELRRAAERDLPPPLAEMVVRTPEPFVQAIVDVETPRLVHGRACLIGDAAFAARPHAAAGTAKAAHNARTLAEALDAEDMDVPRALARWEPGALALGRALVARTREIGDRSQSGPGWTPGDPAIRFGLHRPGDHDPDA